MAAFGAVVVLPALLAVLGPRVDALDVRKAILHRFGREPHRPEVGVARECYKARTAKT